MKDDLIVSHTTLSRQEEGFLPYKFFRLPLKQAFPQYCARVQFTSAAHHFQTAEVVLVLALDGGSDEKGGGGYLW